MTSFFRKLSWLGRRKQKEAELEEEIRFHLEEEAEERRLGGLSPEEAHREAGRSLGSTAIVRENTRAAWGWIWLEQLLQDLRYALRSMLANKTFTALAMLSLALGIGANTAIFSFMDAIMFRSLPVPHPETLVTLGEHLQKESFHGSNRHDAGFKDETGAGAVNGVFPYAAFQLLQQQNTVFSTVFGFQGTGPLHLMMNRHAAMAEGEFVSGNYFEGLGVIPAAGRMIATTDDRADSAGVAVISFDWSQTHFGGAENAIGQPISVNNKPFTVIGVTPPEFFGADPGAFPQIFISLHAKMLLGDARGGAGQAADMFENPDIDWVVAMARLRPGVTATQATAATAGPFSNWERSVSAWRKREIGAFLARESSGGIDGVRRYYSRPLFILLFLVGLILVIATANIANLLLARSASRKREMAVRLSIGAGRSRIIRQLLTESVLLSSASGLLGLAFANWGVGFLTLLMGAGNDRFTFRANLNWHVLATTAGLSLATGVLFGLAPAIQATGSDVMPALKDSPNPGSRRRWFGFLNLQRTLIVTQIVLATLVLVTTGLFVRTLSKLESIRLGFNPDNLLTFTIDARKAGHVDPEIFSFYNGLQTKFSSIPGVHSTGLSDEALIDGGTSGGGVGFPGQPIQEWKGSSILTIGPGFLKTMQIPLVEGRDFDEHDGPQTPRSVLINETFARKFFGQENPIDRRLVIRARCPDPIPCGGKRFVDNEVIVIGVSGDTRYGRITVDAPPILFLHYMQNSWGPVDAMTYELRWSGSEVGVVREVQKIVAEADPRVPVGQVKTQTTLIQGTIQQQVTFARLCTIFAVLALAIACVGLYGTTSYAIERRTNEIGIRMALGAQRGRVMRMILSEVFILVIVGVAAGLPIARATTRLVASFLYDVKPGDPLAITAAVGTLAAAALVAAYLPARRASRIDPMIALRHE